MALPPSAALLALLGSRPPPCFIKIESRNSAYLALDAAAILAISFIDSGVFGGGTAAPDVRAAGVAGKALMAPVGSGEEEESGGGKVVGFCCCCRNEMWWGKDAVGMPAKLCGNVPAKPANFKSPVTSWCGWWGWCGGG